MIYQLFMQRSIETTGNPDATVAYEVLMDDFSVGVAHLVEYLRLSGIEAEVPEEPRTIIKLWR